MAEFIAKLGLDTSGFVAGMDAAASKSGAVSAGLDKAASSAKNIAPAVSSAGNAIEGIKDKAKSLGDTFSDVGKTALGMFGGAALMGGVQGLIGGFDKLIEKGLSVKKTQNEMQLAFGSSGLKGEELNKTLKANAKNVEDLSYKYAVSKGSINDATKAFVNFGGKSDDLKKTQEQLIVLQQRYGISAENAGRLLGKATDPENEASLKRLGIVFDKNATEAERQAKIQAKLGESMAILKEQANGPAGSMERFKNSLAGFSGAVGASLIETIGPILSNLSVVAEYVIKNVLPAFKQGLASLREGLAPIGSAIMEGIAAPFQVLYSIAQPVISALINAFMNIKNAIMPATEGGNGFKSLMETLAPVISVIVGAVTAYYAVITALEIKTKLMTAAEAAYGVVTQGLTTIKQAAAAAQIALNTAMEANPIGVVLVAVTALGAAFYLLYQKSETFRNMVQSVWEWVKKLASNFVDFVSRVAPIAILFRAAYENIKPFRDVVDYVIDKLGKLWDGIKNVAGAIGSFFSSSGKAETAPAKKKEEAKVAVGAAAPVEEAAAEADEKTKKAGKSILETKKEQLNTDITALKTEQQTLENKIKQLAIDERRKLTDDERLTILNSQLKLNKDIEQATRRVYQVTGEGANIKVGLKLSAEESAGLKNDLIGQIDKLSEEKIKLGLELVKLSDEQKKAIADRIKQEAAEINDDLKDVLTLKTFIDDSALGTTGMTKSFASILRISSDIKQLRDKANEAAAVGDEALAKDLIKRADETQDKFDAIQREAAAKRLEDRKKAEAKAAEDIAKQQLDITKLFQRKMEDEKLASAKRVAENTELLNSLKREEDALNQSLKKREISYEEFSVKYLDIEKRRAAAQAKVQQAETSALTKTTNALLATTNEIVSTQLNKLSDDFFKNFDQSAANGTASLEDLGTAAAAQFGAMVVSGKSAGDALKDVSKTVVGKLIDMYVAPVILSTISFLGPLALPIATALVASAKSLFNSAVSGFQDGGYTGDSGTSSVAGVVHGQEFVHTAGTTRKYRPLFEHLHRGGELSTWMVTTAGALQSPVATAPSLNTYGIESRLDRLETAIIKGNRKFESMRAVQMTVQHDPTLTIKAQSRNLEIRSARA